MNGPRNKSKMFSHKEPVYIDVPTMMHTTAPLYRSPCAGSTELSSSLFFSASSPCRRVVLSSSIQQSLEFIYKAQRMFPGSWAANALCFTSPSRLSILLPTWRTNTRLLDQNWTCWTSTFHRAPSPFGFAVLAMAALVYPCLSFC